MEWEASGLRARWKAAEAAATAEEVKSEWEDGRVGCNPEEGSAPAGSRGGSVAASVQEIRQPMGDVAGALDREPTDYLFKFMQGSHYYY